MLTEDDAKKIQVLKERGDSRAKVAKNLGAVAGFGGQILGCHGRSSLDTSTPSGRLLFHRAVAVARRPSAFVRRGNFGGSRPAAPTLESMGRSVVAAVLLAVAGASAAWAGGPTDELKVQIGRVLATFHNPTTMGPEHGAERQAVIGDIMDTTIDFTEVARRSLGDAWATRTPAERTEFVDAFRHFLKRAYLGQLDRYGDERIVYETERVEGDLGTVKAHIEAKDRDSRPLTFKVIRDAAGPWRIYDIVIDDMSLTDNYHAQFTAVLRRTSFEALVTQIRARVNQ